MSTEAILGKFFNVKANFLPLSPSFTDILCGAMISLRKYRIGRHAVAGNVQKMIQAYVS